MTLNNFSPINRDSIPEYRCHFNAAPQAASDYSFVNIWAWAKEYGLTWIWDNDLVWLRQSLPYPAYWAPVGNWETIDWQSRLPTLPEKLPIIRVPEKLARLWQSQAAHIITGEEAREHWDYIYDTGELITLEGRKFHKKKNLLNQFKNKHDWHYIPMEQPFVDQVLKMQLNWCTWRNCEASAGLAAEDRVISKVLQDYTALPNLLGGVIMINEFDVAAFIVAEIIRPDTLVVHFEKGMGGYKGIYQAINQMFLAANPEFTFVNREQDLGNEGLRKAKMSYNPIKFIKKYTFKWLRHSS